MGRGVGRALGRAPGRGSVAGARAGRGGPAASPDACLRPALRQGRAAIPAGGGRAAQKDGSRQAGVPPGRGRCCHRGRACAEAGLRPHGGALCRARVDAGRGGGPGAGARRGDCDRAAWPIPARRPRLRPHRLRGRKPGVCPNAVPHLFHDQAGDRHCGDAGACRRTPRPRHAAWRHPARISPDAGARRPRARSRGAAGERPHPHPPPAHPHRGLFLSHRRGRSARAPVSAAGPASDRQSRPWPFSARWPGARSRHLRHAACGAAAAHRAGSGLSLLARARPGRRHAGAHRPPAVRPPARDKAACAAWHARHRLHRPAIGQRSPVGALRMDRARDRSPAHGPASGRCAAGDRLGPSRRPCPRVAPGSSPPPRTSRALRRCC